MRIAVFGLLLCAGCAFAIPAAADPKPRTPWIEDSGRIMGMAARGDHAGVVAAVDRFYQQWPLDDVSWPLLVFRGDSQVRLGDLDAALETFLTALPYIRRIERIEDARRWARVLFQVGSLHARRQEWIAGIAAMEDGLRLAPENPVQWFVLGDMFTRAGDRARAVAFFRALLEGLPPRGELRVVATLKLERLGERTAPEAPDLSGTLLFPGARVRLLPVGAQDRRLALPDLCLLVQSKW